MNLNIDFNPQREARLTAAANRWGVDPTAVLEKLVDDYLPPIEQEALPIFPPTGRAAERLRARLANEATDDPEVVSKAQLELDEMKSSMNEERVRSGAEPIF